MKEEKERQGTGEVAVFEACVRSVPAPCERRRIFHRTSAIDDSCSCWTRSQKKDRPTGTPVTPSDHQTRRKCQPKGQTFTTLRNNSKSYSQRVAGWTDYFAARVTQRANSVRNNELEQSTRVTEGSGAVLQYQGQRRTRRTLELSLEENDSSRPRSEGRDWL